MREKRKTLDKKDENLKLKKIVKKQKLQEQGITLIALAITIIILLILAGVSIRMLTGKTGILLQSKKAADETITSSEKEGIYLCIVSAEMKDTNYKELTAENLQDEIDKYFGKDSALVQMQKEDCFIVTFNESKRSYNINERGTIEETFDWKKIFANAKAPNEQIKKDVIGIGTDGKPVNMDLWQYTLMEDGTYGLNDENSLLGIGDASSGYDNSKIVNGEIQGTIPQYIKENDGEFRPVTDLRCLFLNTQIEKAPIIPLTVKRMKSAFHGTKITKAPMIPYGVEDLYGTFAKCESLKEANIIIPDSVKDMYGSFLQCSSLIKPPKLGEGVENLEKTFEGCSNLQEAPIIPKSVTNIRGTFKSCQNLKGVLTINGNISGEIYEEDGTNQTRYAWCLRDAVTNNGNTLRIEGDWTLLKENKVVRSTFGIDENNSNNISSEYSFM